MKGWTSNFPRSPLPKTMHLQATTKRWPSFHLKKHRTDRWECKKNNLSFDERIAWIIYQPSRQKLLLTYLKLLVIQWIRLNPIPGLLTTKTTWSQEKPGMVAWQWLASSARLQPRFYWDSLCCPKFFKQKPDLLAEQ